MERVEFEKSLRKERRRNGQRGEAENAFTNATSGHRFENIDAMNLNEIEMESPTAAAAAAPATPSAGPGVELEYQSSASQEYEQVDLDVLSSLRRANCTLPPRFRGGRHVPIPTPIPIPIPISVSSAQSSHSSHGQRKKNPLAKAAEKAVRRQMREAKENGIDISEKQMDEMVEIELRFLMSKQATQMQTLPTAGKDVSTSLLTSSPPFRSIAPADGVPQDNSLTVDQRDYLTTVIKSGETLLSVINDILLFSKLESGEMQLEEIEYCPLTCIEETLAIFALAASQKQIDLIPHSLPTTRPSVIGDVLRIRQCLTNLIGNAIKFCGVGGEIEVTVQEVESECLQFSVRDTGIGIPVSKMDRLFKAFSQVDASDTRKYGGTGLGLAITKRLVEQMRGRIWVESIEGVGTIFSFTVRAATVPKSVAPVAAGIVNVEQRGVDQKPQSSPPVANPREVSRSKSSKSSKSNRHANKFLSSKITNKNDVNDNIIHSNAKPVSALALNAVQDKSIKVIPLPEPSPVSARPIALSSESVSAFSSHDDRLGSKFQLSDITSLKQDDMVVKLKPMETIKKDAEEEKEQRKSLLTGKDVYRATPPTNARALSPKEKEVKAAANRLIAAATVATTTTTSTASTHPDSSSQSTRSLEQKIDTESTQLLSTAEPQRERTPLIPPIPLPNLCVSSAIGAGPASSSRRANLANLPFSQLGLLSGKKLLCVDTSASAAATRDCVAPFDLHTKLCTNAQEWHKLLKLWSEGSGTSSSAPTAAGTGRGTPDATAASLQNHRHSDSHSRADSHSRFLSLTRTPIPCSEINPNETFDFVLVRENFMEAASANANGGTNTNTNSINIKAASLIHLPTSVRPSSSFFLLCNFANRFIRSRARSLGFHGVLVKPIKRGNLLRAFIKEMKRKDRRDRRNVDSGNRNTSGSEEEEEEEEEQEEPIDDTEEAEERTDADAEMEEEEDRESKVQFEGAGLPLHRGSVHRKRSQIDNKAVHPADATAPSHDIAAPTPTMAALAPASSSSRRVVTGTEGEEELIRSSIVSPASNAISMSGVRLAEQSLLSPGFNRPTSTSSLTMLTSPSLIPHFEGQTSLPITPAHPSRENALTISSIESIGLPFSTKQIERSAAHRDLASSDVLGSVMPNIVNCDIDTKRLAAAQEEALTARSRKAAEEGDLVKAAHQLHQAKNLDSNAPEIAMTMTTSPRTRRTIPTSQASSITLSNTVSVSANAATASTISVSAGELKPSPTVKGGTGSRRGSMNSSNVAVNPTLIQTTPNGTTLAVRQLQQSRRSSLSSAPSNPELVVAGSFSVPLQLIEPGELGPRSSAPSSAAVTGKSVSPSLSANSSHSPSPALNPLPAVSAIPGLEESKTESSSISSNNKLKVRRGSVATGNPSSTAETKKISRSRTSSTAAASNKPEAKTLGKTHPLKLLVAEDNLVNQKVITKMLGHLGYSCVVVGDGTEAVEVMKKNNRHRGMKTVSEGENDADPPYDGILMDMQMPSMGGVEATQIIRATICAAHQPHIVALTANVLPTDRDKCMAAGMNAFISKPILIEQLKSAIKDIPKLNSQQKTCTCSSG